MRRLFQMGTPRGLQTFADLAEALHLAIGTQWARLTSLPRPIDAPPPFAAPLPAAA
jgi:hypothetical protein